MIMRVIETCRREEETFASDAAASAATSTSSLQLITTHHQCYSVSAADPETDQEFVHPRQRPGGAANTEKKKEVAQSTSPQR